VTKGVKDFYNVFCDLIESIQKQSGCESEEVDTGGMIDDTFEYAHYIMKKHFNFKDDNEGKKCVPQLLKAMTVILENIDVVENDQKKEANNENKYDIDLHNFDPSSMQ